MLHGCSGSIRIGIAKRSMSGVMRSRWASRAGLALAYEPTPIQDFCVSDPKSSVKLNGIATKFDSTSAHIVNICTIDTTTVESRRAVVQTSKGVVRRVCWVDPTSATRNETVAVLLKSVATTEVVCIGGSTTVSDDAIRCLYKLLQHYIQLKVESDLEEIHACFCILRRGTRNEAMPQNWQVKVMVISDKFSLTHIPGVNNDSSFVVVSDDVIFDLL
ncbi:hypothetical protein Tco_0437848 [Tanacetum coccineum]